jgi:hypothetical protein
MMYDIDSLVEPRNCERENDLPIFMYKGSLLYV